MYVEVTERKQRPQDFTVGCAEDLTFQITRLQEDVERRVAFMTSEREEAEKKHKAVEREAKQCQASAATCSPGKEQGLMMEMKDLETEIDIRRHAEIDMTWRRLYACLWRYRNMPLIHNIEKWFTVPHVDINKGCPRLKTIKGYELVHQCICAEDEEVTRILKVAKIEAAKSVAKQRLNKAMAARNNKRAAKLRQREKDTAKQVAQEIVYNNLQKSGNLNQALREASKQRVKNPAVAGRVSQMVNEAKAAAKMEDKGGACANKEVDCKSVAGGAGVDMNKLEGCLSKATSEVVKSNLRNA